MLVFMWTRYLIIDLVSKVDRFELQKFVTFLAEVSGSDLCKS